MTVLAGLDLNTLTSWKTTSLFIIRCYLFPISRLPTGQGRVKKCNLFLIEWIINYYRDPCNISWYSSWVGSVENAQSHLLSWVHKVYDGIVPGPIKKKKKCAKVSLGLEQDWEYLLHHQWPDSCDMLNHQQKLSFAGSSLVELFTDSFFFF